jgi:transcriptional regulator with XRE-family HTH domain
VRVVTDQLPESLAAVVGRNCKRIRSEFDTTQDELAGFARRVGLRWTTSSVGDFEAARSAPTFATVLAVTAALQRAWEVEMAHRAIVAQLHGRATPEIGPGVTLADLVGQDGLLALTDSLSVPAAAVAEVCRGRPFTLEWGGPADGVTNVLRQSGLTEERLARRLGINRARLAHVSSRLWQSTFSEERNRRAGPDANQQKRGRVSRELRAELEKAIADGND